MENYCQILKNTTMVDFVKFYIKDCPDILRNTYLDFQGVVRMEDKETEVLPYRYAEYNKLTFKSFLNGGLLVTGSLHQFKNCGGDNADDFTFSELEQTLETISLMFNLPLERCWLQNIEFGVNFLPFAHQCREVLENVLMHENNPFDSKRKGLERRAVYYGYICKLYSKRYLGTHDDLIRWELHYNRMEKIKKFGIRNLQDLRGAHWIDPIGKLLIKEWDRILLFDNTVDYDRSDNRIVLKINQWSNLHYWKSLNRRTKCYQLKMYKNYIKINSMKMQELNKFRIIDKWNYLNSM